MAQAQTAPGQLGGPLRPKVFNFRLLRLLQFQGKSSISYGRFSFDIVIRLRRRFCVGIAHI
jgi:hypothetical protein